MKNVPGRPKTDKLDAVWLAKLAECGMVRASFVPPKPVRQLRDLTRTRTSFIQDRTRHKHRVEKLLEDAQIRLSTVVSEIGVSPQAAQRKYKDWKDGPTDPEDLLEQVLDPHQSAEGGST